MTWLFAVLIVLLMGAVAVVAAGAGGSMSDTYPDRRDVRVPADRPLTAQDLHEVRFTTAVRGYRMSEVDALLELLANQLDGSTTAGSTPAGSTTAGSTTARGPGDGLNQADAPADTHRAPEADR